MTVFCLLLSGLTEGYGAQLVSAENFTQSIPEANQFVYYAPSEVDEKNRNALNTIISVNMDDVQMVDALRYIADKGDLRISYSKDVNLKDWYRPVSLQLAEATVLGALYAALEPTDLLLKITPSGILIAYKDQEENFNLVQGSELENIILQETVEGTVRDSQSGEALPGVNIIVEGTTSGTTTDPDGYFELTVPGLDETLVFTYIGYDRLEVPLDGSAELDIQLSPSVVYGDEIMVTALGIEREAYTLGYSTQRVGEDDISTVRSGNWINTLQGQVAGLSIQSAGSGVMGTSRITLRGENTLDMSRNEALIVVDGIPINSRMQGTGANSYLGSDVPVDYGDGISDLNPDDIASINVLKGPSAAALYGSRAANGAIIIETKSPSETQEGIGVTYSSGVTIDRVQRWLDYQTEYGSGSRARLDLDYYSFDEEDGRTYNHSVHTWGLPFEGQTFYQFDPDSDVAVPRTWEARDFIRGYFRTGVTINNNLSVSRASELGSFRLSLSNRDNEWIIPNTGSSMNSIDLSSSIIVTDFLRVNASGKYTIRQSDNLPSAGYGSQSPMYFFTWNPNSVDVNWLRNYWLEEDVLQDNRVNGNADNPWFQAYEQIDTQDRGRLIGMLSMHITPTENTYFMLRSGLDRYEDFRETIRPLSSVSFPNGMYREQTVNFQEVNTDFLFTYMPSFTASPFWEEFETEITIGGNYRNTQFRNYMITAEELLLPGVYNLGNSAIRPLVSNSLSEGRMVSLYSMLSIGRNWWYLDLTARNDWSSTLPEDNNSYFYPSASLSLVLSELFDMGRLIDFTKLRLSLAQVGNDTDPYRLDKYYSYHSFDGSLTNPGTIPNQNLKPEIITSYEAGFDVRMFGGRLNLDATVYHSESVNQIINVPVDPSSGFTSALLNAGQINNTGVEVMAGFTPIRTPNFQWNTRINWDTNRSEVVSLAEGVDNFVIRAGVSNRVFVEARPGENFGNIYGRGFLRSPDGEIVHDNDGYPMLDDEFMKTGNIFPDWTGGISNRFSYRGLSINTLFDFRKGGDVYSLTYSTHSYSGQLTNSLPGRYDGNIELTGVVMNEDGTYSPNTRQPTNIGWYYNALYERDNVEANTLDTSFIKLREVSIGYDLPPSWLQRFFVQRANISVTGRNLYTWTSFGSFDPETGTLDGNTIFQGIETGQFPSTASYSFNIQLSF